MFPPTLTLAYSSLSQIKAAILLFSEFLPLILIVEVDFMCKHSSSCCNFTKTSPLKDCHCYVLQNCVFSWERSFKRNNEKLFSFSFIIPLLYERFVVLTQLAFFMWPTSWGIIHSHGWDVIDHAVSAYYLPINLYCGSSKLLWTICICKKLIWSIPLINLGIFLGEIKITV